MVKFNYTLTDIEYWKGQGIEHLPPLSPTLHSSENKHMGRFI